MDAYSYLGWLFFSAAASAEIYQNLTTGSLEPSLDDRIDETVKLAEGCAAARESMGLTEEFVEMDVQATKLWNLSASLPREGDGDGVAAGRGKRILNSMPFPVYSDWTDAELC
jgi:hypothetical protein